MSEFESSSIIPVFNQWELTCACLKSLAATTKGTSVEVIVVDNASSDVTPNACPFLGEQLFGEAFRYSRCPANLNFGPASNIGAGLAKGKFLIFLNNDTVALPGWYQPLIDDFSTYPDIAATGPLLLYPESEPFGHTVQHLGVFVSPFLKVGHLYEGIPADSPLTKKRRFFQIITAACMVMRRSVFFEAGRFDEHFINGFEDVDLCARLWSKGYRMTVNPQAKVIHYKSQTPGRHEHEEANFEYLARHSLGLLVPDWHLHLKNNGMYLRVGPWQTLQASLPPELYRLLDPLASVAPYEELKTTLIRYPFWERGWECLIGKAERESGRAVLREAYFRLCPDPHVAMDACEAALSACNSKEVSLWFNTVVSFCKPFESYVTSSQDLRKWCAGIGLAEMAGQYANWTAHADQFQVEQFQPFLVKLWRLVKKMRPPR